MALRFNGIDIPTSGNVSFNGGTFREVRFNGVTFWLQGDAGVAPPAPGFCDASDDEVEKITIRWGYSSLTAIYKVFKDNVLIATVTDEELFYEDHDITVGSVYEYYVTACYKLDTNICSGPSETDEGTALPYTISPPTTTPINCSATDGTDQVAVVISWDNDPAETNATHLHIYRDGSLLDIVAFGGIEYYDLTAFPGTVYDYYVAYANDFGIGPISNSDSGFRDPNYIVPDHEHVPADIVPQGENSTLDADMIDGLQPAEFPISTPQQNGLNTKPTGSWTFDGIILNITM